MIERAIENWLTSTNERNYQTPFCQILLKHGHRIIYNSSHRSLEQGKDIITIDPSGDYCAYQLKTGNFDLKKWRDNYGEIVELIEHPIQHPSVDKSKIHKSFLVTNGEISDEVRLNITQMNEGNLAKKRKVSTLDVVTGRVLLQYFIEAQGEFIPRELSDFRLFLNIFLYNGRDFFPKDKYSSFFDAVIFNKISKQKSNNLNAISSSVIINSYLLKSFQENKNYFAVFEGWVCLIASAIRYAIKANLDKNEWRASFSLMFDEIINNLFFLKKEAMGRKNFLEGNITVDGDVIYRARTTMLLGAISALENHVAFTSETYSTDVNFISLIKNNINKLWLWGESAVSYFINVIKYLEINGEQKLASDLLISIFKAVIKVNSIESNNSLPSPYYSVDKVLEAVLGIEKDAIDFKSFSGGSYILECLIFMLTRRDNRRVIEDNWRKLSHIQLKEFIPDNNEDYFAWHIEDGTNSGKFPNFTQSWRELIKSANDLGEVIELFFKNKEFMPFFIMVYPQRLSDKIVKVIDRDIIK